MEFFALGDYLAHALANMLTSRALTGREGRVLGLTLDVRLGPGSRHYGGGIFGS